MIDVVVDLSNDFCVPSFEGLIPHNRFASRFCTGDIVTICRPGSQRPEEGIYRVSGVTASGSKRTLQVKAWRNKRHMVAGVDGSWFRERMLRPVLRTILNTPKEGQRVVCVVDDDADGELEFQETVFASSGFGPDLEWSELPSTPYWGGEGKATVAHGSSDEFGFDFTRVKKRHLYLPADNGTNILFAGQPVEVVSGAFTNMKGIVSSITPSGVAMVAVDGFVSMRMFSHGELKTDVGRLDRAAYGFREVFDQVAL